MQSCLGSSFTNWFNLLYRKKDAVVLMIGLDAVGQTSILYRLKQGEFIKTIPTIGFNEETIEQRSINIKILDVGGGDKIRPLWKFYFNATSKAVIFVVDSSDRERIAEASDELAKFLWDNCQNGAILLVLANKQDIANAMTVIEITDKLQLPRLRSEIKWHIKGTCAVTGEGLREGLDWLALQLINSGAI